MHSANTLPKEILGSITLWIIAGGFLSLWLCMAKKIIRLASKIFVFDRDRAKALLEMTKSFPRGATKLFFPILTVLATYTILFKTFGWLLRIIFPSFISTVDFEIWDLGFSIISTDELLRELLSFSLPALESLFIFLFIYCIFFLAIFFFTILWLPEIVLNERRPFRALLLSWEKLFSRFKEIRNLFFCIVMIAIGLLLSIVVLMLNPFLYVFVLILFYYFIVYLVVLLLTYYEQQFTNYK
jgi:hypothetical protein